MASPQQQEYPSGEMPPIEQITNHIRNIFKEVGPHSLTMKILRLRLSSIYKLDFKDHTSTLSELVQKVIQEPSTNALLNESFKDQQKKVGGTKKKSKSASTKKGRDEKEDKKSKKKHRAEGEPKKALSAFFFFGNETRPKLMEEMKATNNGKVDIGAIGKKIGEIWGTMDEAAKAKYEVMAVNDKDRYKTEMDAFLSGGGVKGGGGSSKKGKKEKDPNAPKRPTTAYFYYMGEVAPALREKSKAESETGKMDIAAVGKAVGAQWNALSDAEKAKYLKMAEDDKARYDRECKEKGIAVKVKADAAPGSAAKSGSSASSGSSSSSDDE